MIGHCILFVIGVTNLSVSVQNDDEIIASLSVITKLVASDVVVTGKIAKIEENSETATWPPGNKQKSEFKFATVKVESAIVGADNITHVRVGFLPSDRPGAMHPMRGGYRHPLMKEGQEMLFFLAKHPTAGFYCYPDHSPPEDLKTEDGRLELKSARKFAAVIADPMKGLKNDKPEVRAETAAIMVAKYRTQPAFGGEMKEVPIPADENKLVLKAIAEPKWDLKFDLSGLESPTQYEAFNQLRLSEKDGWKKPKLDDQFDFSKIAPAEQAAYVKWLDGPGKDYVIKRFVPKKESDK